SIDFNGRQVGSCVGYFAGEIKYLARKSRYLKCCHFLYGVAYPQKVKQIKQWIGNQKYLTDFGMVPYWITDFEEYEDCYDQEVGNIEGVARFLFKLSSQIRKLYLHGLIKEELVDQINFSQMKKLQRFSLEASNRPYDCDGEPYEFSDTDLK